MGSDNYGEQPSAICAVEVAICCGDDGAGFRGDHERITLFDIDGDGRQELITAIRRGSPRGTLVVSLQEGDDLVHNSGGGFETGLPNSKLTVTPMVVEVLTMHYLLI